MKLKENKGVANSIVVMLLVCILILIFFLFYFIFNPIRKVVETKYEIETPPPAKTIEKKTPQESNTTTSGTPKTYTCKDLKGKYTCKVKEPSEDEPGLEYELYLNDDGTFCFEYIIDAAQGFYGNYIIDGDKVILNKLFEHDSGVGLYFKNEKINMKINDDGTLTSLSEEDKGTFTRTSKDITEQATFVDTLKSHVDNQEKDNAIYFFN